MAIDTSDRCPACGLYSGHTEDCPARQVRIVDKREQKRQEAEERRLAELTAQANEVLAVTPEDVAATAQDEADDQPNAGDVTERQARIIRLKVLGRERDLDESERAELLRLQAAEEDNEGGADDVVEAVTAFLVVIDHNGVAQATSNVNLMMRLQREATVDDMDAGCHIVTRDILASQTAKQVIFGMQVSAQAMQRQAAEQATLQRLQGGGAPSGRRR